MTNLTLMEQDLRSKTKVPNPSPAFQSRLQMQLEQAWEQKSPRSTLPLPRLAWAGLALGLVLLALILVTGPNQVLAQIRALLGFVPGVGVVDSSSPLRVLAKPVQVTREGITLEVNSALVSPEVTYLDYQVFGVPAVALAPDGQAQTCTQEAYLRLPDGSRLQRSGRAWPGIPADLMTVTLVVPCLEGTREGTVPEGWDLELRLITPDQDPVQLPLLEVMRATPSAEPAEAGNVAPVVPASSGWAFEVSTVIETPRGYILAGPGLPGNFSDRTQIMHPVTVKDAQGQAIPAALPAEFPKLLQSGAIPDRAWAIQFAAEGLAMPLELSVALETQKRQLIAAEPVRLSLDLDAPIAEGQEKSLDQHFEIDGKPFRLVSMRALADGYHFTLEAPSHVIDLILDIEGYQAVGASGGSGEDSSTGARHLIELTRIYEARPVESQLRLVISGYMVMSVPETQVHSLTWEPSMPHAAYPKTEKPAGGVCLSPDGLPAALDTPFTGAGWAYFSRNEGGALPNLYRVDLATGEEKLLAANLAWPAVAASGEVWAYPGENGLKVMRVEQVLPDDLPHQASQIKWSPDGSRLAFLSRKNSPQDYGLAVVNADGSAYTKLLDTGYAYLAGWSPDGKSIVFLTSALNLNGWKVQRYDLESQVIAELFTLNEGTIKYLDPELSPDGAWLAYRALDSSSVRLVRLDGSEDHLLGESLQAVELSWASPELLALSLSDSASGKERTVLVNTITCGVSALPESFSGSVVGIKTD